MGQPRDGEQSEVERPYDMWTAQGADLDQIGKTLAIPRSIESDADYRARLIGSISGDLGDDAND